MARACAFRIPTSYSDTIPTNEVFVFEQRWRKWRLKRRKAAYLRMEAKMAASDLIEAFDWIAGQWTTSMIATTPTWVLETRPLMPPKIDDQTRARINDEIARRQTLRAQMEARISIVIAGGSMLVALASWLIK